MRQASEHRIEVLCEMKKKTGKTNLIKRYDNWGVIFILPWLIGFLVFQLYPLAMALFNSFTDYDPLRGRDWVGLRNYIRIFKSDLTFRESVRTTFIYVLFSVPAKIITALLVALLMNLRLKAINLFRTVYYLPSIFGGSVAISILWRFLFKRDGVVNGILAPLNIPGIDWLGNPRIALFTVSLVSVWQFGSSMVLFLAQLKNIPPDLYEAAKIDGGNAFQRFWNITFPSLTPILFFNILMQMINAFQEFTLPFVITNGGPSNSTYLFSMLIYDNAFRYLKMGYASALSWLLFLTIMIITLLLFKTSARWVFYGDGG